MQFTFAARRGRRVFQRFNLQQTATLSTRVPIAVSHVRRVFRLSDNRSAPLIKNGNFAVERLTTVQRHHYSATAEGRPRGRPKGTKGTKKPKTKKAKKPKKTVKELSPEQLEKKKVRQKDLKLKEEIKELKEKSLRKEEPKLSSTILRNIFFQERLRGLPGKEIATAFQAAVKDFSNISTFEKQALERQSVEAKEENKRVYTEWLNSYTPLQIKTANYARKRLANITAEQGKRSAKYPQIKDDRLVKMPSNSFGLFFKDRADSGDLDHMLNKERMARAHAEWKSLSEQEKDRYTKLAAEDKERYIKEYREVYGQEPGQLARNAKTRSKAASPA